MASVRSRIQPLWVELKRRKVVRVTIAYIVAAGGTIQLADVVAPRLGFPDGTMRAIIVLAIIGLPIAVALAWLFDVSVEAPTDPAEDASAGGRAPPPASPSPHAADAEPARARVYNAPRPATPLVGRASEVAEAEQLLADPDCRLLTLTGPPGIGKTRLAQEIAARAEAHNANGVCFVPLAGVETIDAVPAAIADALDLQLSPAESPARQLASFLREKTLVLFLDNFEQVVDCAGLVSELLARAPLIHVLVTSRRRLRVAGETVLVVGPLGVPEATSIGDAPAASLFVQIARRAQPHFTPNPADEAAIARICRVVDGIPLALELAAASVGTLSCAEIARELEARREILMLRDLPARHQSLHAALESSWRQLAADEQAAFRRLSVFRGWFDQQGAAAVANASLTMLARLVEASLVQRTARGGFEMLDVLRTYGEEMLAESEGEQSDVRRRHSRYVLGRLSDLARLLPGAARDEMIERLAESASDVRAAWLFAATNDLQDELRAAAPGLFQLLDARGRAREGAHLFHRAAEALRPAAEAAPQSRAAGTRARMLTRDAAFSTDIGRVSEAAELVAAGLETLRAEDDRAEIAFALSTQCRIARANGDYRASAFEESLALYRELRDQRGVASSLNALGAARLALGEYDDAKRLLRESVALFRRIGLHGDAWPAINNLAGIAQAEGDYAGARRILEDELEAARGRKNPRALSFLLINLGYIAYRAGDRAAARPILAESAALAREMGYRSRLGYSLNTLASIQRDDGESDAAALTYRAALDVAVDAEETPLVADILFGVAKLEAARGEGTLAVAVLTAVRDHPALDESTRGDVDALLRRLRDAGVRAPAGPVSLDDAVRLVFEAIDTPALLA